MGRAAMRLILADDSILLRQGLASLLTEAGFEVIGQAGDPATLLQLVRSDRADVAVVDIRMPPRTPMRGCALLSTSAPIIQVWGC